MKKYIEAVKIDNTVIQEIQPIIQSIVISFNLFRKFDTIMTEKIKLADKYPLSKDTAKKIKELAWLIFILVKSNSTFLTRDRAILWEVESKQPRRTGVFTCCCFISRGTICTR
jgi:hypothetical protein